VTDTRLMQKLKLDPAEFSALHALPPMQRDMYLDSVVNSNSLQSAQGFAMLFLQGAPTQWLRQGLQAMLNQHSILRAQLVPSFESDSDVAYLAVRQQKTIPCDEIQIDSAFSRELYLKLASEFIYKPYALPGDELLRTRIVRFSDGAAVVLVAMHHLISDGSSFILFRKHFLQACSSAASTAPEWLGDDNFFEFADTIRSQTDTLDITRFWKQQLAGVEPLQFHPMEPAQRPNGPFPFMWQERPLDAEHSRPIKAFCRKKGITPALYFKLLYCVLLHHYCRPDANFFIQEAYSVRPLPSHSDSQGCYLQQLPFPVDTQLFHSEKDSFDGLIHHAKVFQHTSKAYRALSLKLINEISPPGRLAFMYNFYHFLKPIQEQEQFEDQGFSTAAQKSVQYIVETKQDHFIQRLLYDTTVFTDFDFLARIESLSQQIVEQQIDRLSQLHFVSSASELDTLRLHWNNTVRPFDLSEPLHRHFERQAQAHPEKAAVIYQKQSISYAELERKANELAHALIQWGVQPGDLVALFSERHPDFLVAMLATLKTGGAYVPLDATYPDERVMYMLGDCDAKVILTRSTLVPRLPVSADKLYFCLDTDWHQLSQFSSTIPQVNTSGADRAYMIYTSGSTGAPKGALIRHNGALNHIFAEQVELNIQQFHFLQTAPLSSDISVWQFLAPVITGGACIILEDVTDIPSLIKQIDTHQVNIVELVPVVLTLLLDFVSAQAADRSLLPSLKVMMATGEAVPVPLINRWLKYFPNIPITNAYGPTEAADDAIQITLTKPLPVEKLTAPIGRPLANFSVYILDPWQRLVPAGVIGEICIAGTGVGEGYWNNPVRTAESFIDNPFARNDAERTLYKTGDLGRWTADGVIEYIDRIDNQIKIRGHRIELGEVEAQLAKHPLVKECAAWVHTDSMGDKYIVGYVVAHDKNAPASGFRHFLKQRLPAYMLPRHILLLQAFPTTPAGKIDRKNLPVPNQSDAAAGTHAAPQGKVESKLAIIWQKALHRPQISREDNFFDLGGHSVMAIKVLQEIEQEFAVSITPTEFMQADSLYVLAQLIQSNVKETGFFSWQKKSHRAPFQVIVPLKPSGSLPPLFCVHGAGGNIFGFHQIAQCIHPEQPFYGIQAQGIDGLRPPLTSVAAMAAAYVREIQKIQAVGPYYLAGYSAGSVIALEIAQQLTRSGQQVGAMISIDLELERISAEQPIEKIRKRFDLLRTRGLDFLLEWAKIRSSWEIWRLKTRALELIRDIFGVPIPLKFRDRYLYEKLAAACKEYKVAAYPGVITLLRARDQDRKTLLPGGGWEKISMQPVEVLETPGDHYTIFTKPLLPKVAAALDEALENARTRQHQS